MCLFQKLKQKPGKHRKDKSKRTKVLLNDPKKIETKDMRKRRLRALKALSEEQGK